MSYTLPFRTDVGRVRFDEVRLCPIGMSNGFYAGDQKSGSNADVHMATIKAIDEFFEGELTAGPSASVISHR